MPGFNLGATTDGKNNLAEYRRNHRWRVAVIQGDVITPQQWLYLQKAARPNFEFDEVKIHHNQEEAYVAGKQRWQPIDFVFYDAIEEGDISSSVFGWILGGDGSSVADGSSADVNLPRSYKKDLTLEMLDGSGDVDETWTLHGAFPLKVDWSALDYTNTEIILITANVRFDRATRA